MGRNQVKSWVPIGATEKPSIVEPGESEDKKWIPVNKKVFKPVPTDTVPLPPPGWEPPQQEEKKRPTTRESVVGAGKHMASIPVTLGETVLATGSGLGSMVTGWAAQAGKSLFDIWKSGGKDVSFVENRKIRDWIQEVGGYQPRTPGGQALSRAVALPFEGAMKVAELGVHELTDDEEAREALMLVVEGALILTLPKMTSKAKAGFKRALRGGKAMASKDVFKIINESKEVPKEVKADIHRQIQDIKKTPARPPTGKEVPGQRQIRMQKEIQARIKASEPTPEIPLQAIEKPVEARTVPAKGLGKGIEKTVRKEGDLSAVSEADIAAFKKAGGEVEIGRPPARTEAERTIRKQEMLAEGQIKPGEVKGGGLAYGMDLPTKVGNVRIDKLKSSYDIKKTLVDVADMVASKREMSGKSKSVPWEQVEADAARIGMTVESLRKARGNKAYNAAELEALRRMEGASIKDLHNKQKAYSENPSDLGLVEMNAAMERALMITESYSGAASTAGRALNILRKGFEPGEIRFKAMEQALKDLGGREKNQHIVEMMQKLDWDNHMQVLNFIRNIRKAKVSDKIFEVWVNGLLSGPQTHIVNTVSNGIMLADKLVMTVVAGLLEAPKALTGKKRNVYLGEAPAGLFGVIRGLPEGVRKGLYAWTNEMTMEGVSKLEMRTPQAIKGKKGKAVRVPGRALVAFDELFKSMIYSADIHSMAYKSATRQGLKGKAKATEVARLISNPTESMMKRATGEMLRATFQNELGKTGKAIQTARSSIPGLRYIIPFLKVSINIPKAGLKRTPLNIPRIIWLASKGKLQGEALSIEIARAGVGSLTAMAIYDAASKGQITGAAPTETPERDAFYAEGKQPYSVKVGDKYYSYGRLEPVSTIFGVAADAFHVFDKSTEEEKEQIASKLIKSITENLTNKTFMQGLTTAMNAISDPERSGQYFLESLAGTAVPTGVAQVAKAIDPTLRETETIVDHIKSRIPGVSKKLPPKVDRRGKEVKREGGVAANILSPVWVSTEVSDKVDKELRRLKVFPGRMSKETATGDKIPPTPYAKMLKDVGPKVFKALDNLISSKGYKNFSDEQKQKLVKDVISRIKSYGRIPYKYKQYDK